MKLHFRIVGEGSPVIILHGLFGMSDNWQSFAKELSGFGYACYLPDLRNHGHSPHDDSFSIELLAKDVAELIQDHQLEKPVILGHSLGGKTAMRLLIDNPELISKLIVVDIAPYEYPVHHRGILDALLSVDLEINKTRSEVEKILSNSIEDSGTRQFLMKNLFWKTPDQLGWRFNLEAINKNIVEVGVPTWPSIPVQVPVLFVSGENSRYIDPSRYNEIKKWFLKAEFVTIANAGHWVHADQPKLLLDEVLRFLI